jgi:hypothetical protein
LSAPDQPERFQPNDADHARERLKRQADALSAKERRELLALIKRALRRLGR